MPGVTVTKTKVIGFLLLFLANMSLILVTRSVVGFITAFYAMLSCLEYQILETGVKGMPLTYMGQTSSADLKAGAQDGPEDIERGKQRRQ